MSDPFRKTTARARGLSLPELLVALAVAVVVAMWVVHTVWQSLQTKRLQAHSAQWGQVLRTAREAVQEQARPLRLELLEGQSTCLILHTGPRGACGPCQALPVCREPAEVLAQTSALPPHLRATATASSVQWNPGTGTVSPTTTIRLSLEDGRSIHHVLNLLGRVRICSPGALVGGVPPC